MHQLHTLTEYPLLYQISPRMSNPIMSNKKFHSFHLNNITFLSLLYQLKFGFHLFISKFAIDFVAFDVLHPQTQGTIYMNLSTFKQLVEVESGPGLRPPGRCHQCSYMKDPLHV